MIAGYCYLGSSDIRDKAGLSNTGFVLSHYLLQNYRIFQSISLTLHQKSLT